MVASDSWNSYIDEIFASVSASPADRRIFIVALTRNAINLSGRVAKPISSGCMNSIRIQKQGIVGPHWRMNFVDFLAPLSKTLTEKRAVVRSANRLFLSHSKRDNKALILATASKGLMMHNSGTVL